MFPGAPAEEFVDGIRVIREGSRNLFNFLVYPRYRSRFRHEGYDVIVDDLNKIPFFTPAFVREPLVGIVHHLFGKSIFVEVSLPAGLYVSGAEQAAFPFYRRIPIAVVSESTKSEMLSHGFQPEMLTIVPNAIDHRLYRQIDVPTVPGPVIGYLGRMKKYKSVDHLLRALPIIRQEHPTVRTVFVGDGDSRPGLEQLARELGLADAVRFTGFVPSEEKVRLLNQMHVVVNTSAKEGWGLTVVEANACGVPVVASDVPGLRDSVLDGTTGLLYEYGNIEQLAEKVCLVLRDDVLRKRLADEAVTWAGSFTWERSAERMIEMMERAIRRKRS
jgi:glycosyltransferase involved in cell wall biosynthesis